MAAVPAVAPAAPGAVCVWFSSKALGAPAHRAVTSWAPGSPFPWVSRWLRAGVSNSSNCISSAGPQHLVNTAREKGQGLSICVFLCAASVYFLFFNPYFLTVEVLVLTRDYLFIKYVQESARVPVAPPEVDAKVWPAAAEVEEFLCLGAGRRKERAEKDRDFTVREQIFTGSKTKKYIYSVVLGIQGAGLEAQPAHGSVCYTVCKDCWGIGFHGCAGSGGAAR